MVESERLSQLLDSEVVSLSPVGGGDICEARHATLADGSAVFVKTRPGSPEGFFRTESDGLSRLRAAKGGVNVPAVRAVNDEFLVLDWIITTSPSARSAEKFGRALAATHRAGYEHFGSQRDGWIGSLPLPNRPWSTWPEMWAEGRLAPFLESARSLGSISQRDASAVAAVIDRVGDLAGPAEAPALVHGDLWAGNVLWGPEEATWLIDPAAHGGHRETDLAMLALFGAPFLDHIVAAYNELRPLSQGWKQRVALHQLHPVLVHAVLFGRSYGAQAGALARSLLTS